MRFRDEYRRVDRWAVCSRRRYHLQLWQGQAVQRKDGQHMEDAVGCDVPYRRLYDGL